MKILHLMSICALLAAIAYGATADAASRALLVAVSDYQSKDIKDLPGVRRDLDIMQGVAEKMGIPAENITTLADQNATYQNIRTALAQLIQDTEDGDMGLFYFSGHGGQFKDESGDEDDKRDEALIPHDAVWNDQNADKILLDDELATLYSQATRGKLLILVDACNSGTSDKGIQFGPSDRGLATVSVAPKNDIIVKSQGYIDVSVKATDAVAREPIGQARYVALNAAQDDEFALSGIQGSYFTLGLREALANAAEKGAITPNELKEQITHYLKNTIPPGYALYTPKLVGYKDFYAAGIHIASKHGIVWDKLAQLVGRYQNPNFAISTDQGKRIRIGQFYNLQLNLPMAGYLSVIAIDSGSRQATVLLPNGWVESAKYPQGQVIVPPTNDLRWGLLAQEPPSTTLIVAIVTPTPLNLHQKAAEKGANHAVLEVFRKLLPAEVDDLGKNLRSTGAAARAAAAQVVVDFVQ